MVIERIAGIEVLDATYWVLTIGTIGLLIAYVLATLGAIRFLFFGGRTDTPKWQIVVPILAILLLAYTLYKNAVGLEAPYSWFPHLIGVWLVVGVVISFAPGLMRRITEDLSGADPKAIVP